MKEEESKLQFEQNLARLNKIVGILSEIGFKLSTTEDWTPSEMLKDNSATAGIPLVMDGTDGIRFFYSDLNGLRIGFANGFMDLKDPRVVRFMERLREEGLADTID